MNPAGSGAPWLEEIQRTAGDISPATATQIQRAAEYAYQHYARHWGQAWGQYAARQFAKAVLAGAASRTDPQVETVHRAYREAQEHADRLLVAAAAPDGTADVDTPEGLAAWTAHHQAEQRYEEYQEAWAEASVRHSSEINQAWRTADADFVTAHRAELHAAWPEGFAQVSAEPSAVPPVNAVAAGSGTAWSSAALSAGRPAPGLPKGLDFPSAPAVRSTGSPGRRAGRSGIAQPGGPSDSPQLRKVIEELEAGAYPQPEDAIWRDDLPRDLAARLARATGTTDEQITAVSGEPPGQEETVRAQQLNSYKFDVIAVTTVNVRAETEDRARAMIDGLNSITTRTTGDDIEAVAGLDVSTNDYDVVNVSPRGRGYLVGAETWGGEEISVSALELIPEPTLTADRAGLREELAEADRALAGDSNDAEHDALHGLAEAVRGLLDESNRSRTGESSPAAHAELDLPHAPTAGMSDPAQPAAPGTATPPVARTPTQAFRRVRGR